jgi:hypothetical protein
MIDFLVQMKNLKQIDLRRNPVVLNWNFWFEIIVKVPWLENINGETILEGDRLLAKEVLKNAN